MENTTKKVTKADKDKTESMAKEKIADIFKNVDETMELD